MAFWTVHANESVASHAGFFPQEFFAVVEPGDVVEHVFILEAMPPEPPGAFVGRVLGLLDEGRLIPIRDALVRLLDPDGEICRAHTNRYGRFAMPEVPPGLYMGVAHAVGWLPAETEVEIRPGEPTYHVFVLHRP